jgi:hypothetical protein
MSYDACDCDYDAPEFCDITTVKARKPHRCYECRGSIKPGESYERTAGKWDGDFCSFKTCALCRELRRWAVISVPCFCWTYGELHENVRDMVSEVRSDAPSGFIFEWGRRMIRIERNKYAQHWPRQFLRHRPRRSAAEIALGIQ